MVRRSSLYFHKARALRHTIYYMAHSCTRSDWLLSGQDFLVMTGYYETLGENNKKYQQNITIFSISERKILAYRYLFSMSDEESHSES